MTGGRAPDSRLNRALVPRSTRLLAEADARACLRPRGMADSCAAYGKDAVAVGSRGASAVDPSEQDYLFEVNAHPKLGQGYEFHTPLVGASSLPF
jgi:hypothetical protein